MRAMHPPAFLNNRLMWAVRSGMVARATASRTRRWWRRWHPGAATPFHSSPSLASSSPTSSSWEGTRYGARTRQQGTTRSQKPVPCKGTTSTQTPVPRIRSSRPLFVPARPSPADAPHTPRGAARRRQADAGRMGHHLCAAPPHRRPAQGPPRDPPGCVKHSSAGHQDAPWACVLFFLYPDPDPMCCYPLCCSWRAPQTPR